MKTSNIALFFKGMAMGTVDIVPGVSGSTVAVLLGIYERFIAALKNINLPLLKSLGSAIRHPKTPQVRADARTAIQNADLPWLLILLSGLFAAFIVASFVIPSLMDRFPQIMRGIFFGLVLGSIVTPIRNIHAWRPKHFLCIIAFASAFFFILGQHFSPPSELVSLTAAQNQSLESICLELPCFNSPEEIIAMPQNEALRAAVQNTNDIIPDGLTLTVTRPYPLLCLLAGFLGICAMLLPGISGSFILLVLGCYYFMLNTGKGFLYGLSHGSFYGSHLLYLACFALGALIGIAAFSRALSWLLKNFHEMTLAAIIGILLGCLRAVWPYRNAADGSNILPAPDTPLLWPTLIAIICGLSIVIATVIIQKRLEARQPAQQSSDA